MRRRLFTVFSCLSSFSGIPVSESVMVSWKRSIQKYHPARATARLKQHHA